MLEAKAIGRLVSKPTLRTIRKNDTDYSVCEFRLACQQRKGEVDFVKVAAWRGMGNFIFNHVQKGQKIYIGGKLKIPPYDKEKGRAYEPYIVALSFEFCDSKSKAVKEAPHEEPSPDDASYYDTLSEEELLTTD